jgi:hypothetical protein
MAKAHLARMNEGFAAGVNHAQELILFGPSEVTRRPNPSREMPKRRER